LDWKTYINRKYDGEFKLVRLGSNGQFEPKGLLYIMTVIIKALLI